MQLPVTVLNANTKREQGRKAQLANIMAAKAVADIIRTTLGPRSMLKMLLDPNGGIVLTNDGHAILREIDVTHPAAKSMIQLSRTQDEEVGDGTTSVIILAGELLHVAEPFLEKNLHPTVIVKGYAKALADAVKIVDSVAFPIDTNNREQMLNVVNSCVATKFTHRFGTLMAELALTAVQTVAMEVGPGQREIDVKNYAKVEKIPGGTIEDCRVLRGGQLGYYLKAALLKAEEDAVQKMCEQIAAFKPDLVITEKGLSDLAAHFLTKAGISAIRRLRKTDNNRIARACGATIVHRTEEIRESDIGTKAGLFEVVKIGDEFFTFIVDCEDPKACTILLQGASKDILNEVGVAMEVIPRTLAQNCGANVIRTLTKLRAK
ncbi:chaperonin complex component, partial [Dunaliella salina]